MLPSGATATDHGSLRASSPVGWKVAQRFAVLVEDLDTVVLAIGDVDVARLIDADVGRLVELTVAGALAADHELAGGRDCDRRYGHGRTGLLVLVASDFGGRAKRRRAAAPRESDARRSSCARRSRRSVDESLTNPVEVTPRSIADRRRTTTGGGWKLAVVLIEVRLHPTLWSIPSKDDAAGLGRRHAASFPR